VRSRDAVTGETARLSGVGDVAFVLRQNLANPDGSGVSVAVQGFVVAPTGRDGIGADGWEGGVIVPVSVDLGGGWALALAPEVDYVGDEDGDGHHYVYAGVIGISRALGDFLARGGAVRRHRRRPGGRNQPGVGRALGNLGPARRAEPAVRRGRERGAGRRGARFRGLRGRCAAFLADLARRASMVGAT
jgi:hypothetical protein